ncbi:MAG TPA: tetratricopeptide repeat protein [Pyrinomonadaceae bacterium]|jgi:tetratricopeptide (TPR) repeat protein|nr:tetratricopeptide repeat protein [Pyrinomonadaceae bacterium]
MGFDKAKAIRAAEKYLAQGKISSAIQEYQRIVEADAGDYTALNTVGDLYARLDMKAEAVACYQRVAEHYREQGFTLKAVAMYKKLSRFGPEDHRTALVLAQLYEQQGLLVEARAQYLVAADAFTRAGDTREALEVLRRIADLDPTNTHIRLRLAETYARENIPDLAAEAYTLAGERLASRGEFEQSLDAFTKALVLRPASHPALAGLLAAHTALGTADEAAEVLEQVSGERGDDLEVRAMLVRAYVEAEDAWRAEVAAQELVVRDPSSFTLYFDLIRLHLQQGSIADATRLLGWVADPALSGRQEAALIELLQETVARDPEQMEAHRLLVRVYTAMHDDARLRSALERLADAAEATGDREEERRALTRLASDEPAYRTRLEALGGPLFDVDEAGGRRGEEVPTFESFVLKDEADAASESAAVASQGEPAQFEWNAVAEPQHADASASFADLNDLTDGGFGDPSGQQQSHEQPPQSGFQEFDFGAHAPDAGGAGAQQPEGAGVERMLRQELESIDFYIEKGYADIARDTLDMLERQYGKHAEIDASRQRLAGVAGELASEAATMTDAAGDVAFGFVLDAPHADAPTEQHPQVEQRPQAEPPTSADAPATPTQAAAAREAPAAGIDPGLAAIFDEFREAIEDSDEGEGADHDTHYQMGLAYREMGLHDEAVEEFQTAAGLVAPGDGTPRYLRCCNMLGHCFMEKGMPRPAALWFKRGLAAPGHTEDEYQAMRYDLGTAYERMGDTDRAIEVLSEVYAIDVSYRGVAERLRELQKTVNRES